MPTKNYKVGKEFLPYHPSASHTPPEYRDGWNACYSVAEKCFSELEAKLADAKNQWIPVSERLPKEGESVFVYSKYGQSDMADFVGGAWENCWLIGDADETITHWVGKPKNPPTAIKPENT